MMTSVYGTYRGFTLVEVLVAILIIGGAFTSLLTLLSNSRVHFSKSRETFERMVFLDSKLKLGNHEDIAVERHPVPDFPAIKEATYTYKDVFFIRYEPR